MKLQINWFLHHFLTENLTKMVKIIIYLCSLIYAFHLTRAEFSPNCSKARCSRCMTTRNPLTISCHRLLLSGCCVKLYIPEIITPDAILPCDTCNIGIFNSSHVIIGISLVFILLSLHKYFYLTRNQFRLLWK